MNDFPATVLLVDDDAPTRYTLRRWLTHLNARCHVLEATDGAQALAVVQEYCRADAEPYSLLVLLDMSMPVMDGQEFLEHQARLPAACRTATTVVVLSAATTRDQAERLRTLAADIRIKPLDIDQLASLVYEYLPATRSALTQP